MLRRHLANQITGNASLWQQPQSWETTHKPGPNITRPYLNLPQVLITLYLPCLTQRANDLVECSGFARWFLLVPILPETQKLLENPEKPGNHHLISNEAFFSLRLAFIKTLQSLGNHCRTQDIPKQKQCFRQVACTPRDVPKNTHFESRKTAAESPLAAAENFGEAHASSPIEMPKEGGAGGTERLKAVWWETGQFLRQKSETSESKRFLKPFFWNSWINEYEVFKLE